MSIQKEVSMDQRKSGEHAKRSSGLSDEFSTGSISQDEAWTDQEHLCRTPSNSKEILGTGEVVQSDGNTSPEETTGIHQHTVPPRVDLYGRAQVRARVFRAKIEE